MNHLFQLPLSYLLWHYLLAWGDLIRLYRNLVWFLWNFFSVALLSGTLLSPWKRLHEGKNKGTGGFVGSLILNLILRFIGFFARLFTILSGLIAVLLLSILFLALIVLWPLLPLIIVFLVVNGIRGLVTF